jgi:DNA invertase Pin-like site-specific DNA recombinase
LTGDQHLETQLLDLREMAKQRRYEIVQEYSDIISESRAKRPGLDQLLADARRHRFDIVLVAAFDRVARTVRHFLKVRSTNWLTSKSSSSACAKISIQVDHSAGR